MFNLVSCFPTMEEEVAVKPHAVCIALPVQSHIKAMLKLSKLLHHKGFHITFVNTEYNHKRLLKSKGFSSFSGLPDFRFETIPDGLPPSDLSDATQDIPSLCLAIKNNFLGSVLQLVAKLNDTASPSCTPPVCCLVSDGFMAFSVDAAQQLGLPLVMLFTVAACGLMGFKQYSNLIDKGIIPLKDESYLTNGYLDTVIDWIPGMKDIRLRDLPSFLRTTDPNDIVFNFIMEGPERAHEASAIVIHTINALEQDVLDALSSILNQPIYSIAPLQLLLNQIPEDPLASLGYSLWKEDTECLKWLNSKAPNSVLYVNFGSIAVLTPKQLEEFAWGLANSKHPFLWIIRPDLVEGESAILPNMFVEETKGRSLMASWCPQEQVLNHPSIGGFLTHSGWNSTIESLSSGVPMICWPFFAEQQTNCWYVCGEWGIGLEIENDVNRDGVERLIREVMEGEKGKEMKKKTVDWKRLAEEATSPHGSSSLNLEKLIDQILLSKRKI